jgi:hypothetical protein
MDEILLALLEILAELFFEAVFEFALEFLTALVLRGIEAVLDNSEFRNPLLAFIGYVFLGAAVGGISLLFVPHPFVHPSRFPGISVIISPVLAGLGMSFVGSRQRKRNRKVMQIESFGYGFAFAFGMALVRFLFVTRGAGQTIRTSNT